MAQQVRATEVQNGKRELTADVYETAGGEAYVIEVPVPGLRPDEINIEVTIDTVTISDGTARKLAGSAGDISSANSRPGACLGCSSFPWTSIPTTCRRLWRTGS